MNDMPKPSEVKPKISVQEMEDRRKGIRLARDDSRLEGMKRGPESDVIFDAYIRGEIEVTDIVPRLKAQIENCV